MIFNTFWSVTFHLLLTGLVTVFLFERQEPGISLIILLLFSITYICVGRFFGFRRLSPLKLFLSILAPTLLAVGMITAILLFPGSMNFNWFYYIFYNAFTWLIALSFEIDPGSNVFSWSWLFPSLFLYIGVLWRQRALAKKAS